MLCRHHGWLLASIIFLSCPPDAQAASMPMPIDKVQSETGIATAASEEMQRAQLQRLEAERRKIELESREIEHRLNARWWEGQQFTQYALALLTFGQRFFFGWFKLYIEPVLNQKSELNLLKEQINTAKNEVLESNALVLKKHEEDANKEKERIATGECSHFDNRKRS